jgi:hypothetical protein
MKRRHLKILSAAAMAFLVSWNCNALVYSQGIYSAGITHYGDHCVGPDSFRFGYSEYSYSTDAAGRIIWVQPERLPQQGDTFHRQTQIYLGPTSFSVPMRPLPFFLVVGISLMTVLGLGDLAWKFFRRRRYESRVA